MAVKPALVLALSALAACAAQPAQVRTAAEALAPLLGCWRGEFANAPDIHDERCFETLSGEHVVDTHHVRPTQYSGETTYHLDEAAREIVFAYSASDGGRSNGSMQVEQNALIFPEHTYRGADGSELRLRSTWRIEGVDRFVAASERLENGDWRPFMQITYTRTSAPE
jgi:hypothetical protein